MNNLEALTIVLNCSRASKQMATKRGRAARRTVEAKIQSLLRKKAWRDSTGGAVMPVHMHSDEYLYAIPEDPITSALRKLLAAEKASKEEFTVKEITKLEEAMNNAQSVLDELDLETTNLNLPPGAQIK